MFNKFFSRFSKDIGIDLGTANTLIYVKDKGIVINEPSVVAVNLRTEAILAVGEEAKKMVGKTPAHIIAIRPLKDGVISDFEATEKMLKFFINKLHKETSSFIVRPKVVIGIPMGITEVEKKAVEDATLFAGAREVYLIEEPIADAIGARLPIHEPTARMIVDIGGGTTEIAIISLSGIVTHKSLRIAGDEFNETIISYVREKFNVLIGETTAENVKIKIGSVYNLNNKELQYKIQGRNLLTGLPVEIEISDSEVREAITRPIKLILENIKLTLESSPPELAADIYKYGILLCGGGALLRGLDQLIIKEAKVPVVIADDPITCAVRGTGLILEDDRLLREVALPATSTKRRQ